MKNTFLLLMLSATLSLFAVDSETEPTNQEKQHYQIVNIKDHIDETMFATLEDKLKVLIDNIYSEINLLFSSYREKDSNKNLEEVLKKHNLDILFNIIINYAQKVAAPKIEENNQDTIQDLQQQDDITNVESNETPAPVNQFTDNEIEILKSSLTEMAQDIYPKLLDILKAFETSEEGKSLNLILEPLNLFLCYDFQFTLIDKNEITSQIEN